MRAKNSEPKAVSGVDLSARSPLKADDSLFTSFHCGHGVHLQQIARKARSYRIGASEKSGARHVNGTAQH